MICVLPCLPCFALTIDQLCHVEVGAQAEEEDELLEKQGELCRNCRNSDNGTDTAVYEPVGSVQIMSDFYKHFINMTHLYKPNPKL